MKLTELNPRWALDADIWVCGSLRLGIFFANPVDGKSATDDADNKWTRSGESFNDLTLTPSVDCSVSGHWHGSITNGEVT